MAHKEKMFKLENGDRLKIKVDFHFSPLNYTYDKTSDNMRYDAMVWITPKGKRKSVKVNNEDWLTQIQETALELWHEFKPNFTQA